MYLIIIEAPCVRKEKTQMSVWDIDTADIYGLLSKLRSEGQYTPQTASSLFGPILGRLHKIVFQLKELNGKTSVYFVAPYGVISEEDYVVKVQECFEDLSIPELEILFEKFKIKDRIYDIIEQDFELAVICLNRKILRILDLEYYLPTLKPIIILSDVYTSSRSNIFVITPTHFLARRISKSQTYGSEFCMSIISYISKTLTYLRRYMGKKNFKDLMKNPQMLFQIVFSPEIIDKILEKKELKLDAFFKQ